MNILGIIFVMGCFQLIQAVILGALVSMITEQPTSSIGGSAR